MALLHSSKLALEAVNPDLPTFDGGDLIDLRDHPAPSALVDESQATATALSFSAIIGWSLEQSYDGSAATYSSTTTPAPTCGLSALAVADETSPTKLIQTSDLTRLIDIFVSAPALPAESAKPTESLHDASTDSLSPRPAEPTTPASDDSCLVLFKGKKKVAEHTPHAIASSRLAAELLDKDQIQEREKAHNDGLVQAKVYEGTDASKLEAVRPRPPILQAYYDSLPAESSHRNLVHLTRIQKLRAITPDTSIATVENWEIAVPMYMFTSGELVLFMEKDCFIPLDSNIISATSRNNDDLLARIWAHTRTETVDGVPGRVVQAHKVSGIISQGLIFPPETCQKLVQLRDAILVFNSANMDAANHTPVDLMTLRLADWLGVTKWEVPSLPAIKSTPQPVVPAPQPRPHQQEVVPGPKSRPHQRPDPYKIIWREISVGEIPKFIRKTSMKPMQHVVDRVLHVNKYKNLLYQETVKLDGASMHAYFIRKDSEDYATLRPLDTDKWTDMSNGRFGVCSHNKEVKNHVGSAYWQMAHKYRLAHKMNDWNKNAVLSGELVGHTAAGNHLGYKPGEHDFFVFRIQDLDNKKDLHPHRTVQVAKDNGLKHVEVRREVKLPELGRSMADLDKLAETVGGEGLVYRALEDGRTIKLLNKQWTWHHKT